MTRVRINKEQIDTLLLNTHMLGADLREQVVSIFPDFIELEGEVKGEKPECCDRTPIGEQCVCKCHRPSKPKIKPLGLLTPEWAADLVETINVLIERENERP